MTEFRFWRKTHERKRGWTGESVGTGGPGGPLLLRACTFMELEYLRKRLKIMFVINELPLFNSLWLIRSGV